ncbi:MAG: hypothetical protein IT203_01175 [Fimbriimonadaceae bacterium]|nr:hypothetical protein [Fimbriimonadaceae bacterium]
MKRVLKIGVFCLWFAVCALAGAQTNQQKLADALTWLNKVKGGFATEVQADIPAIESILTRYFTTPDSLRASEEEIALAFLETMPKDDDMGTRGGTLDKLRRFEALLGAKPKTTAVPPVKSNGPAKVVKSTTPAKAVTVTPKHKIPGIHSKATFTAISRMAPGGKTIGAVMLNIGGRSKTVVEVLAGTSKLDAQKRAAVVAKRMQTLNKASRLWWTMLKVGQVKGQYVVGTGGKNFVITADSAFATEWGLSPAELAKQLILKIRSSLDPEKSEMFGSRDLSPEELRIAAIDLRQQGDALYASNPSGAEAKYKQAIANDPTYAIPYLRIADIRLANKDSAGAKAILDEGLKVAGMSADQKSALESKLKTIS